MARKLQSRLAAYRPHADHRHLHVRQAVAGDQFLLPDEAVLVRVGNHRHGKPSLGLGKQTKRLTLGRSSQGSNQSSWKAGRSRSAPIGSRRLCHGQPLLGLDVGQILLAPRRLVAGRKRPGVIHFDRQEQRAAGADVEPQPGIRLAALGQNEHHGPVGAAEDPGECLLIGLARLRASCPDAYAATAARTARACGPDRPAGRRTRPPTGRRRPPTPPCILAAQARTSST